MPFDFIWRSFDLFEKERSVASVVASFSWSHYTASPWTEFWSPKSRVNSSVVSSRMFPGKCLLRHIQKTTTHHQPSSFVEMSLLNTPISTINSCDPMALPWVNHPNGKFYLDAAHNHTAHPVQWCFVEIVTFYWSSIKNHSIHGIMFVPLWAFPVSAGLIYWSFLREFTRYMQRICQRFECEYFWYYFGRLGNFDIIFKFVGIFDISPIFWNDLYLGHLSRVWLHRSPTRLVWALTRQATRPALAPLARCRPTFSAFPRFTP